METTKDLNFNLLFFFLGLVVGFCFSLCIDRVYASEIDHDDFVKTMIEQIDGVYAPESCIVYDDFENAYYLITFEKNENPKYGLYENKSTLFFDNGNWETGVYFYDYKNKCWVQSSNLVTQFTLNENQYVLYSTENILDENGNIYFYKTSSVITNKYYHGVNTIVMQKIPQSIQTLIPICIGILAVFIGINLIPKIIYKFL